MTKKGQALSVLMVNTLAFTVCFMAWMMFGVIGIPIKKALGLNATEPFVLPNWLPPRLPLLSWPYSHSHGRGQFSC